MEAIWILSVIFTFIIIISTIDNRYNLRKKKIDAALRMREMEMGLPPGTYSSTKLKGGKRKGDMDAASFTEWKQTSNRTELKKGIDDLQQRLANLETIMNNRRAKPEGMQDKEWKE
ncbi:hypothetical protein [Sphaerochaeta globosa]|uniref:Uncharacterized protein n=1 Tax=Sphaerochaeta globosa (strain ATCC BAA-1886 / DSM 22777 / Buddy) TaxID=158189 RepID=F0RTP6_SPHGB|nr:hypothetical protein [Sphaerochaeta globosa]ADY14744.1 hypothetical protein SpiBuddy_2936 [Sphaerochaeta globosa str. Buddy]